MSVTAQTIAVNDDLDIVSFFRGGRWRVTRVTRQRWANGGSQVSAQLGTYDSEDAARAAMRLAVVNEAEKASLGPAEREAILASLISSWALSGLVVLPETGERALTTALTKPLPEIGQSIPEIAHPHVYALVPTDEYAQMRAVVRAVAKTDEERFFIADEQCPHCGGAVIPLGDDAVGYECVTVRHADSCPILVARALVVNNPRLKHGGL